ncbi:PadR family transcriptional regulator [Metabacillus endolithicus]|uniref:PadR family transcriptional regulator n=1 Tax=Metabacillus endolithicus TaxID=1535204 RepID=A0ABW5BQ02_9BACI|nr:PadR family transcriptional regulator [Metabacillus endolithicus]UPG63755.1 PadR family transcriptional regulator [Metabacillus endolithicus]
MEDRLKGLRKSMEKTAFKQLDFTEKHQDHVRIKMKKLKSSDDEVFLAVMQLLVHEKTGYDLLKHIRGRGILKFEDNEGFIYTLLHRLEQNNCLLSRWDDSEGKHYQLNNKGRKLLQKAEKNSEKKHVVLRELLEG